MSATAQCHHPEITINANHVCLGDSNTHYLELTVKCATCDIDMVFQGCPFGVTPDYPTMSVDGKEIRLPMRGDDEPKLGSQLGFVINNQN